MRSQAELGNEGKTIRKPVCSTGFSRSLYIAVLRLRIGDVEDRLKAGLQTGVDHAHVSLSGSFRDVGSDLYLQRRRTTKTAATATARRQALPSRVAGSRGAVDLRFGILDLGLWGET